MIYMLMGYAHAAIEWRLRSIRSLLGREAGQGTVEYVGLILLVSLLMVGMVAAMKGFNRSFRKTCYLATTNLPGSSGGEGSSFGFPFRAGGPPSLDRKAKDMWPRQSRLRALKFVALVVAVRTRCQGRCSL